MLVRTQDRTAGDVLDRPVWTALTTRHRRFAQSAGAARCFPEDIGPFAALRDDGRDSLRGLAVLAAARKAGLTLMQAGKPAYPDALRCVFAAPGVQMIAERAFIFPDPRGADRLTDADAAEMLALAQLTRPGPFGTETHRLGSFWGLRDQCGHLVAMAGERLKQPGYTEISGVCVHPAHRGRGHAARLVAIVGAGIQARGEIPYLHAVADNLAAIGLYRKLGFRIRRDMEIVRLERQPDAEGLPGPPSPP